MKNEKTNRHERTPAANERFGATAAESADLKSSAGKPPLRQAAIPLAAMQGESVVESAVPRTKYSPTTTAEKPSNIRK